MCGVFSLESRIATEMLIPLILLILPNIDASNSRCHCSRDDLIVEGKNCTKDGQRLQFQDYAPGSTVICFCTKEGCNNERRMHFLCANAFWQVALNHENRYEVGCHSKEGRCFSCNIPTNDFENCYIANKDNPNIFGCTCKHNKYTYDISCLENGEIEVISEFGYECVAPSMKEESAQKSTSKTSVILLAVALVIMTALLIGSITFNYWNKYKNQSQATRTDEQGIVNVNTNFEPIYDDIQRESERSEDRIYIEPIEVDNLEQSLGNNQEGVYSTAAENQYSNDGAIKTLQQEMGYLQVTG